MGIELGSLQQCTLALSARPFNALKILVGRDLVKSLIYSWIVNKLFSTFANALSMQNCSWNMSSVSRGLYFL